MLFFASVKQVKVSPSLIAMTLQFMSLASALAENTKARQLIYLSSVGNSGIHFTYTVSPDYICLNGTMAQWHPNLVPCGGLPKRGEVWRDTAGDTGAGGGADTAANPLSTTR